ncbi:MAG: hypothetical protein JWO44_261 [Bacteroidetes bacterium]|nr:hypothetical protein [Bacteroidota bacterium]
MKQLYFILLSAFAATISTAQTFMMPDHYERDTIYASSGMLSDASGTATMGRYTSGTLHIKPQVPGTFVKLTFTSFSLGPLDHLQVFNGLSTYGTVLGDYRGSSLPPAVYSTESNGGLTLVLSCESNFLYQGFSANIQAISPLPPADLTFKTYPGYTPYYPPFIPGGSIALASDICNNGGMAVSTTVSYYISTDTVYSPDDSLLSTEIFGTIYGGDHLSRGRYEKVPGLAAGNYYLLCMIDQGNSAAESNEGNNFKYAAITIMPGIHDLVFPMALDPETVFPGANLYIPATLLDIGNGPAMEADMALYLSTDNIFDASDAQLGVIPAHPSLSMPAYGSYGTFMLPLNTPAGNYTIFMKADPGNEIAETNETNNLCSFSLHVPSPRYDIRMAGGSSTPAWTQGGNFYVNYTLAITDLPYTIHIPVNIFLSADTVIDASDVLLYTDTAYYSYYGYGASFGDTVPPGIPAGNYFLIFSADHNNTITETNEYNNKSVCPLQIKPFETDIAQVAPSIANTNLAMGSAQRFFAYANNNKGGNCPAYETACYLSTDTVPDASDVLLLSKAVDGIRANSSITIYDTINIPGSTLPGQYYVLVVADHNNMIAESNEGNNISYARITVSAPYADLTVTYNSVSSTHRDTIPRGITMSAYIGLLNTGNMLSDTTYTGMLLSADAVPDASDILLDSKKTSPMAAASNTYVSFDLNFASSIPDGDYYLIAYADHLNTLPEPDETNNYDVAKVILGAGSGTIFNFTTGSHVVHTTCGEVIYDSGGNGNYHNNEHGSLTLYPGITGNFIALDFILMDLETCCDHIDIYNGPSTSDPLIGSYSITPSRIVSTHPSGALTLKFSSNASVVNSGFKAVASCVPYVSADLSFSSSWIPGSFVQGESGSISYNCINTGTITAPASFTGFYLSADSVYSSDDLLLGDALAPHVIPGIMAYDEANLLIPASVTPGNYYLLLKADNTNLVSETDESNNWYHKAVIIHPATIDIKPGSPNIVSSYYGPVVHYPGCDLLVSTSVGNILYKSMDTSVVRYFISTDTLLDAWDLPAGYSYRGSSPPRLYFSHDDTVAVPSSLAAGQYFLLAQADALSMFAEADESNNISYSAFMLVPATMDLTFSNPDLSNYTPVPGGSTQLDYRITDAGTIPFPYTASITNGFYLSADTIFDAADLLLGGSTVTVSYSGHKTLNIPAGISPGSYYIILRADTLGAYWESDETNNLYFMPIDIFPNIPDLSAEGLYTANRSILPNYWLNISFVLKNRGYGDAGYSSIHYYFSNDSILDASDTLLTDYTWSGPDANTGLAVSANKMLPPGVSGSHYIIVLLDSSNTITETDETNNLYVLPITIQPLSLDLLVSHQSVPVPALAPGATTRVKSMLELYGNNYLNNQSIGYYLSTDTLFDGSDVYLSSTIIPGISPGPYYNIYFSNGTISIPSGTAYGAYYLLFVADHNNITAESNEVNNVSYAALAIAPVSYDLRVTTLRMNGTATASGSTIDATPLLTNMGTGGTASYKAGFYLSADSVFDASDLFLYQQLMNSLNAGNADSATCTISIPVSIAAGDYYLIAYADYQHVITESSELNNYLSKRISIAQGFNEVYLAGLYPTWGGGIVTSPSGLSVNFSNENLCNLYQFNLKTAFYFSTDTIPGGSDPVLGIVNTTTLSPGYQLTGSLSFNLPPGTPFGNYYIVAYTDYLDYIPETNEANNIRYVKLNYGVSGGQGDLQLFNLQLQDTMNLNVTGTISAQVRANGSALSSSQVGYFLSADWQLDNVDLLLTAVDSGAIAIWTSKKVEADVLLPTWITPGIYYIIAAVDYKNLINESDENNNTNVKPIYVSNVTGIVEHAEDFSMILYPNPSSGRISFKGHFAEEEWGEELKIEILDITGASVYSDAFRNTVDVEKTISVSETNNGIYFLKISGRLKSTSGKYVKVN